VRQRHDPRLGQQSRQFGGDRVVLVRTESDQDEVGIYRRHARLDGTWHDCVIVERMLDESS